MNKIYRSIWNEISRTYVAAAEIVQSRGKRCASSRTRSAHPDIEDVVLKQEAQAGPPARPTLHLQRPGGIHFGTIRPLALEPRFMFDGAALGDAIHIQDDGHQPVVRDVADRSAFAAPRADSSPPHGSNSSSLEKAFTDFMARLQDPASATDMPSGIIRPMPDAREIVFIDSGVADIAQLLKGTRADVEVVVLDPQRDAWQQMTAVISTHATLDAIHLVSHGADGQLVFNGKTYDANSFGGAEAAELTLWQSHLSANADILLYGCDVVAGADGALLINQIARLTQADVAASTDATGSAAKGGDWVLEADTGAIDAKLAFADQALAGYDALLAPPVITKPAAPTILEDANYTFSGFNVAYDGVGTSIEPIVTVTNAASGNLVDNGVVSTTLASQGDLNAINAFLSRLQFQDSANFNGTATISITVNAYNGNYLSANLQATSTTTFDITVTPVNDAPSGTNNTISVAEDGSHIFTTAEFGLTDPSDVTAGLPSGNALNAVKISALPSNGTLANNGTAVTLNQFVSAADIAAGNLIYTPALNGNGSNYGNFTFQVQDNGGTENSGVDTDPSANTMTINVSAVNDAPVTVDAAISVDKNASQTFSLTATDPDGAGDITSYNIVSIPVSGVLKASDGTTISTANTVISKALATGMTFTPATNSIASQTFTFQAIDVTGGAGGTSNTSTVTINVNSLNQAPVLVVPGVTQTVAEDTSLTLAGISLSDPDAGGATVQATLSALHGNIDFTSLTGLTVTAGAANSHSVTVQGTIAAINTALGSSNLTYRPDANYPNATTSATDTITVLVSDLGNTGGAAQTDTDTITVTVTPVADAPTVTGGALSLAAVDEDNTNPTGSTVAALLASNFTDLDGNTLAGLAISADASTAGQGTWQYSVNDGATWSDVGTVTVDNALLLNASAKLRFVPFAQYSGVVGSLTVHAIDNSGARTYTTDPASRQTAAANSGATDLAVADATLGTSVTAVNDVFQVITDKSATVAEGGSTTIGAATLSITDIEASASQIVYTLTGLPTAAGTLYKNGVALSVGGTFTQADINSSLITFTHNGTEPSVTGPSLSVGYSVTDLVGGLGTTAARTLTIDVSPVNDTPVLTVAGGTVALGSALPITSTILSVTDPDNSNAQLVFRLESLPTQGVLTINGAPVAIGSTFSYATVVAGSAVVYTHGGGAASSDTFSVSLRDGAGGVVGDVTPVAVDISVTPTNTAPAISSGQMTMSEGQTGLAVLASTTFSDAQTTNLANLTVQILSLPTATEATLRYNGTVITQAQVTSGFTFSAADKGLLTIDHISANQENPPDVSFTIQVTDDNATTPLSSQITTVNVALQPINDNPTGTAGTQIIVAGETVTIDAALLTASDVDTSVTELTFRLDARPTHGYLYLNGVPLGVGATFTLADISGGLLRYTHDGTALANDSFSVTLRDGEGGSYLDGGLTPLVE